MKNHPPAPNPGEPLLTCFDCGRALTLEQLTLFPWWDERVNEFEAMYRCDRCLPRAHRQLLKTLAKDEKMLSSFVGFASRRVTPPAPQGAADLESARQILDRLVAREAFIQRG